MIDKIKTLLNRTTELEEEVDNINSNSQEIVETNNYITFTKNLLNYSILNTQRILVAQVEVTQNSNIYIQALVELSLSTAQKVTFSIIVDEISIYKSTKSLSSGFNQISIMKAYTPLVSKQIDIYIEITPTENKLLTLTTISLSIWGIVESKNNLKYQAVETEENFVLSYLANNEMYYKTTNKDISTNNAEDFVRYKSAKSFAFAYDSTNKVLYNFRIDMSGKLFYSNFDDKNEIYLTNNAEDVSACSNDDIILVTYIKNNTCYFMLINENSNISEEKQLYFNNYIIKNCYCYYNSFNEKFYVILTDEKNSNYFIESYNESASNQESINASVSLLIDTYGE